VLGSKPLASVLFFPFLALRVGLLVRKRGEFAGHGAGTAGAALAKKLNGDWVEEKFQHTAERRSPELRWGV
jgi:hypothetical protein